MMTKMLCVHIMVIVGVNNNDGKDAVRAYHGHRGLSTTTTAKTLCVRIMVIVWTIPARRVRLWEPVLDAVALLGDALLEAFLQGRVADACIYGSRPNHETEPESRGRSRARATASCMRDGLL